jgi:hypothetical protein
MSSVTIKQYTPTLQVKLYPYRASAQKDLLFKSKPVEVETNNKYIFMVSLQLTAVFLSL